jgi:hypothetical protein
MVLNKIYTGTSKKLASLHRTYNCWSTAAGVVICIDVVSQNEGKITLSLNVMFILQFILMHTFCYINIHTYANYSKCLGFLMVLPEHIL